MEEYVKQNKKAWEYRAYDFWIKDCGNPSERAKLAVENPVRMLKNYAKFFTNCKNLRVANICGSCGKKAVPLAVLGADVTVFDLSEDNKRYALEVAEAAGVTIHYEVCDVLEIDVEKYADYFDVVFMEGGILHFFHDIDQFMKLMYAITKKNGKLICSDFHPVTKKLNLLNTEQKTMSYFSTEVFEGEMAHAPFYPDEIRKQMPLCSYRRYTMSEIVNAVIDQKFIFQRLEEYPSWVNKDLPGEFTIIAKK